MPNRHTPFVSSAVEKRQHRSRVSRLGSIRTGLGVALALTLAGCISFGAEPPKTLLVLTPTEQPAVGQTLSVAPDAAIVVLVPPLPATLANTRVPVRTNATEVAYVKEAQWADTPNRLFQALLSDVVQARTGRPVLNPRQAGVEPGTRIGGELQQFGVDEATQSAVVAFDATLTRGATVQKRRFEARVPVAEITAQPVGAALNTAANQVAAQVADWVR